MTKYFITGGSGLIGSLVIKELVTKGYKISALARSSASADKILKIDPSIEIIEGTLEDLDVISEAAKNSDGVYHLGFIHDFATFDNSLKVDAKVIKAIGTALEGTGKLFVHTNGIGSYLSLSKNGEPVTEDTEVDLSKIYFGVERVTSEQYVLGLNNVKSFSVRLPPTVHGENDKGFIKMIIDINKKNGYVGTIETGTGTWKAVNKNDVAKLYASIPELGKPGSVYHGFTETISIKELSEFIAKELDLPIKKLTPTEFTEVYGFLLGALLPRDMIATSDITQKELHWEPKYPTLYEDIKNYYL